VNTSTLWKLSALTLSLLAPAALADGNDGDNGRGFALGLRAGYGVAFGEANANANESLNEGISGAIPVQLDAGYFLTSHLYLGGSFQYAPVMLADDCEEGFSCSSNMMRFGVTLAYHAAPFKTVDPWVGLGVGYERLTVSSSSAPFGEFSTSFSGFEFAALQGGVDFKLTSRFAVGPFATFTVGQYSTRSTTFEGQSASEGIDEKALHFWLMGGIKAQYRF
jgi:outer membrane protein W